MNRRQFLKVSLLPVAAAAVGMPVFARVRGPHVAILSADGEVVACSSDLSDKVCRWLRDPQDAEYSVQLVHKADREVTVSYYELRGIEVSPRIPNLQQRKSLDPPIWLRRGDKLDFTWEWKAKADQGFGGALQ